MKKINTLMGIFMMMNMLMLTKAQSPGGVAGSQLWYKGDAGIATAGSNVVGWSNSASALYNLAQQGGATTLPISSQINFNPSVRFDGTDDRLATASAVPQNVTTTAAAPYTTSQYVVYKRLGAAMNPLYSHSDGAGGTWNVGGNSTGGMLITNRSIATTAPAINETRLQSLNGSSNGATAYLNGNAISTTFNNSTATAGARNFWVGAEGTGGFVNADIAEIVIYNTTQTALGIQQIESYLSLKYGISKFGNYVASNGTTNYWNASTNTGYLSNITGIGRDDSSVLYQKQSMSTSQGQQVLIGLTGMANTNASNSGTLTDQQFLVVGDNGLAKTPSVTISGIAGVNSRFGSVWKVQNTGSVGTVRIMWPQGLINLKLVQNSSDPTFATGNTVTDMSANTQTINGVVYNYADVSLADGQFFTLAAFVQAPGGIVSGLRFWLKSDSGVTTSGTSVTSWNNQSIVGLSVTQATAAKQPVFVNNYMNFNPGINFASNQEMALPNGNPTVFGTTNSVTAFYLGNSTSVTGSRTVMEMHTTTGDNPTFEWRGTSFGMDLDGTSFQDNGYHASKTVAVNTPYIISSGFNNQNAGGQIFNMFNGAFQNIRTGNALVSNIGTNIYVGGANGGEYFQGNLPEIIGYNTYVNNTTDIQKINSYLAVKYGMTLDQTTALDYLNSAGTVIWNGTANAAFKNNIAGIERDDASALNQKQSMSVNSGSQVVIGIAGALANTNALNTNSFSSDLNSVMWGDNGLAKAPAVPISGAAGANYRFASVWKVQNTGSVGTVRVMWPQGLTNLKLVQNSSDPTFAAGNTVTDMMANTQTINSVVYNYADVSLADGQYFTFAAQVYAPGGVINNLQVWNKADFGTNTTTEGGTVTSWNNSATVGGQLQALSGFINHTASPTYMNLGSNFNPAVRMVPGAGLGMLNAFSTTATASGTGGTFYSVSKAGAGGSPSIGYNVQMNVSGAPLNLSVISPYNAAEMGQYISSATTAGLFTWNTSIDRAAVNLFNPSNNNILGWAYTTGVASAYPYRINGKIDVPASYTPPLFTGRNFHLNTDTDGGLERGGFDYQETIGYERQITSAEQNRIESYLAIKYGVTLGTFATPVNYTSTNSTTVWSTAASSYQTNVIGIARDDIEGLHQRISKSQDAVADIITISTNNDFTTANSSANHTDIANDQFYFITGNNGAATTYNAQNMMNRRWKVQFTGTAQNLYIKTSDIQATYLVYADDAAMTTNVVNIPLTSSATPGIQIPNGKFFTFAKFSFCTKDPNTSPADTLTKIGITIQTKQNGWPENLPNGAVALESKTRGFVITRTQSSLIANPVEGMLMYDTVDKCMKLYNGTSWHCVVRSCNQ